MNEVVLMTRKRIVEAIKVSPEYSNRIELDLNSLCPDIRDANEVQERVRLAMPRAVEKRLDTENSELISNPVSSFEFNFDRRELAIFLSDDFVQERVKGSIITS